MWASLIANYLHQVGSTYTEPEPQRLHVRLAALRRHADGRQRVHGHLVRALGRVQRRGRLLRRLSGRVHARADQHDRGVRLFALHCRVLRRHPPRRCLLPRVHMTPAPTSPGRMNLRSLTLWQLFRLPGRAGLWLRAGHQHVPRRPMVRRLPVPAARLLRHVRCGLIGQGRADAHPLGRLPLGQAAGAARVPRHRGVGLRARHPVRAERPRLQHRVHGHPHVLRGLLDLDILLLPRLHGRAEPDPHADADSDADADANADADPGRRRRRLGAGNPGPFHRRRASRGLASAIGWKRVSTRGPFHR